MLEWNKAKVRNLTGTEIWLMIAGRVLAGFGLGVLAVGYFPQAVSPMGTERRKISGEESIGLVGAVGIELLFNFTKSRVFTVLPTASQMNWS